MPKSKTSDKVRVTVDKEKKKGDKIECQLEDGRVAKITVPHKNSNFWKYKKGGIRQLEVIVPKQKGIEAPQEFVELVESKSVELVEVVVPPNTLPGAVLQDSVPPGTDLDKGVVAPASPLSQLIDAPSSELIDRAFGDMDAISVQQTMRGCLQECCGCEAQSEYKVYPGHVEQGQKRAEGIEQFGHLLEDSSFFARLCLGEMRGFVMPMTVGAPTKEKGARKQYGAKIVEFRKPCGFPLCFTCPSIVQVALGMSPVPALAETLGNVSTPCCCKLPEVQTYDNENNLLGSSEYRCDMFPFVPKFVVKDGAGKPVYLARPDNCCGGCCIMPRCGGPGSRCLYIPFKIRDFETQEVLPSAVAGSDGDASAQIVKVWSGMKKECCSDADNFQVLFPRGIDSNMKANLVGLNVLIDFVWFETQS